jgi:hypothetical protein
MRSKYLSNSAFADAICILVYLVSLLGAPGLRDNIRRVITGLWLTVFSAVKGDYAQERYEKGAADNPSGGASCPSLIANGSGRMIV